MTLLGCGVNGAVQEYFDLLKHFDLVSPVGELSPIVTTNKGAFDFLPEYLNLIKNHYGKDIRGRVLYPVMPQYIPRKWGGKGQLSNPGILSLFNETYHRERIRHRTPKEFRKLLFQHTEKVVAEFDRYVSSWDVCYGLFSELGRPMVNPNLVIDLYKHVKTLTTKPLIYDDYLGNTLDKWYSVKNLLDCGLINGLGIQIHRSCLDPLDYTLNQLTKLLNVILPRDFRVEFTEVEISLDSRLDTEKQIQNQVVWFEELYKLALCNDVHSFVIWSLISRKDHVRNPHRCKTALFTESYKLKTDLRRFK